MDTVAVGIASYKLYWSIYYLNHITDMMVIIFLGMRAESNFFMRIMFPAHWNFSELMKKMGCFTLGKISSSRGNIHASNAMPHL